jgi:hypothetical protein
MTFRNFRAKIPVTRVHDGVTKVRVYHAELLPNKPYPNWSSPPDLLQVGFYEEKMAWLSNDLDQVYSDFLIKDIKPQCEVMRASKGQGAKSIAWMARNLLTAQSGRAPDCAVFVKSNLWMLGDPKNFCIYTNGKQVLLSLVMPKTVIFVQR